MLRFNLLNKALYDNVPLNQDADVSLALLAGAFRISFPGTSLTEVSYI